LEYINLAFRNGGPFMYVILATLIFGIAIIVERFTFIAIKNRIDTTTFVNSVNELIERFRRGLTIKGFSSCSSLSKLKYMLAFIRKSKCSESHFRGSDPSL